MHDSIDFFSAQEHKGHQSDWIIEEESYTKVAMLL